MKKINFLIAFAISSIGFSQTILNQSETSSRTVQDPQTVIMLPGFHATSTTVNPFIAKIGNGEESGGPIDSGAGGNNPSGTVGTNYFHDTQGSIEVNGGGQLQFTLPIALPPGVKSVAPQVNLGYTSGSGNGIAGYGWNISGITSISRMGKTIEKDGELKGVQLDYSDYYSFNGQRLILKTGEYGKDGAEYQTEKYSNVKIKSFGVANNILQILPMPRYWEVTFEDGSQAWYGQIETIQDDSRTPIEYNITKWKDAQGNYITYNYTQSNNVAVISSIQWGGNETLNKPHFNEIIFNYNTRDFKEASYVAGTQFIQDKLLSNVIVKTNGTQFKKYEIAYKKLGNNYQFVDSVTEKNSQDQSANAVVFENIQDNFVQPTTFTQDSRFDDIYGDDIISGDFNGDGKLDFIKDDKIMLGRLEGTNNFFNVSYQGTLFSSGNMLENNLISVRTNLLTTEFDNPNKKLILRTYKLNTQNILVKIDEKIISLSQFQNLNKNFVGMPYGGYYLIQGQKFEISEQKEGDFNGDGISEYLVKINILGYAVNMSNTSQFMMVPLSGEKLYLNPINDTYTIPNIPDNDDSELTTYTGDFSTETALKLKKNQFITGNFAGNGKTDLLIIKNGNLNVYELNNQNQFVQMFSTNKETLDGRYYLGDFNGDGKIDIFSPKAENSTNWLMYISTGKGFVKYSYDNFYNYKSYDKGSGRKWREKLWTYTTSDLNKDGKSDFTIFESQVWFRDSATDWNNPDSSYGFNYLRNEGVDTTGKPVFSNVYNIAPKELNWDGEDVNYSMYGEHYIPLFGNFRIAQLNTDFVIIHKTKLITWDLGSKLNKISKIKSITQGGLKTDIEYANLTSTGNIYKSFYDTNPVQYPYVNITENLNYDVVSRLVQGDRKQDFRYRDMVGHLTGKGMLGFRQTARSTFYADGFENTKVWSGSEMNPLNEALPLKDWSIKTNDENAIFPSDISLNNTQLLSYKDYQYKIDKLLNGVVVTSYTDADKPKIVTSINPYITTSM